MPYAKLKYGAELTKNLGNFENVKPISELEIEVEYTTLDDLDALREVIKQKVDDWVLADAEDYVTQLKALGLGK